VPMLRERHALLEDDRQADSGECREGRDGNEGSQEFHPAPGAEEIHKTGA
jgi:hypothetical protein